MSAYWSSGCGAPAGVCVTPQNVSGYTDPSPRGEWIDFAVNTFVGVTYSDNTNVNNRVNSIRLRGSYWIGSVQYTRACFYENAGIDTLKTSVSASHPGWYDNSSTGLSSMHRATGAQSACP